MRSKRVLAAAPLLMIAAIVGCGSTPGGQMLTPELARNDPGGHLEFWHALPERKVVSNDEAFHALLLFVDGEDASNDYGERRQRLIDKRMLPATFSAPPAHAVRRGTLAVGLTRALGIDGGLTMRVFGPQPRYAVRELQYAGVYPPSSPQQVFSGAEFLGIIGRAEDYQRVRSEGAGSTETPPVAPSAEPSGPAGGERALNGGA